VIEWDPTEKVVLVYLARPPLNVPVPIVDPPSLKVTVPVGVPPEEVTVAVKTTLCAYTDGFAEEATVVVVFDFALAMASLVEELTNAATINRKITTLLMSDLTEQAGDRVPRGELLNSVPGDSRLGDRGEHRTSDGTIPAEQVRLWTRGMGGKTPA
jgi:hypothetical protein